jgi:hypothetical protein
LSENARTGLTSSIADPRPLVRHESGRAY